MDLRIESVARDTVEDWRRIHNEIIPTAPLSAAEVEVRRSRDHLTLAYDGSTLVGNATVRPPRPESPAATVIVRTLPEHRRRGYGSAYLEAALADAEAVGPERIETVILASNTDGLSFACHRGFVEFDRYTLEGDLIPFVHCVSSRLRS